MILTVDIGNTNICIALHENDDPKALFFERLHTTAEKDPQEFYEDILTILSLHHRTPSELDGIVLSSVVPPATAVMTEALNLLKDSIDGKDVNFLTVRHDLKFTFRNGAEDPSSVGSDILCDITGALSRFAPPLMVIDMGTATVLSVINEEPAFVGVFICPGVRTSLNSLAATTSALPSIGIDVPDNVIGTNTNDSMKSGIIYGSAGLIDGIVNHVEEATGKKYTIVATGGLSGSVIPYCRHEIHHDPELLMTGLWNIYKNNV